MWNIRMRASKNSCELRRVMSYELRNKDTSKLSEIHISGAEGIYEDSDLSRVVNEYIKRALSHCRGKPDKIILTAEEIKQSPKKVSILPVKTMKCDSPYEAKKIIYQRLLHIGISKKALDNALKVLTSKKTMRGAALILMKSGIRVEPDKERGIRVSRLGIEKSVNKKLSLILSKSKINITTVKEALILASKVASYPNIVAEVCISDDADYTTGYIASKKFGYLRIPNIKKQGEMHGGRVFFIKEGANIEKIIKYLEKTPVLVSNP
jgi:6-carboxyhexanoate--CoA ligase